MLFPSIDHESIGEGEMTGKPVVESIMEEHKLEKRVEERMGRRCFVDRVKKQANPTGSCFIYSTKGD